MGEPSSRKISRLAAKDVEIVKKWGRVILEISPDETKIEISENPNPRLNILVVIGPSEGFGRKWDKVLLLEIGISRTRPYHEARGLNRKNEESSIPERRKWFSLSPYQYQLVGPIVFKIIERLAFERVRNWKRGPFSKYPFKLRTPHRYWSRRQKKLFESDGSNRLYREQPKGARFTASLKDEFLIRDICWAELNLNLRLKRHIKGLVNFIDLRLNWYKHSYRYKRPFLQLKGAKEVQSILQKSSLSRHLIFEAICRLRDEKRNQFSPYLFDMVGWRGRGIEEKKLSLLAESLPDSHPRQRLEGIQLMITTDLGEKKDYIVFEVFPRQK